jgi:tRNA threonylcarbamoyladenosine biosynthesis protein TsaB
MLLLATDTSGKHGSLALAQCGPDDACEILEVVPLTGGTFSAQLVPEIAALLKKHRFTKRDIDAFAVASGPGSFTGLRVGLAAIKALADVLQKPIAAVSLLEAVALSGSATDKVLAALDAGRNEVFVGEYDVTNAQMITEQLLTRDELFAAAKSTTIVTPDNTIAEIATAKALPLQQVEMPRSDAIARLGWKRIQAGQTVSPEELEANYIRRADAEIGAQKSQ